MFLLIRFKPITASKILAFDGTFYSLYRFKIFRKNYMRGSYGYCKQNKKIPR